MKRTLVVLAACLTLAGCRDESRLSYLELSGRNFIFNPRVNSATYVVTLAVLKDIPQGSRITARFENPAGGAALVVEKKVFPDQPKIALESDNLTCVKAGRRYAFSVSLLDGNGQELQKIDSSLESSLDQTVMPDAPLVVGPAYDKNPALKGRADGKIEGTVHHCPA
jgi:hypothetical protein